MKAVFTENLDGPDGLEILDVETPPSPTGGNVVVHVHAFGINRADLLQIKGLYPPPAGYSPNRPGLEFAGEIAAVGSDVRNWQPGDRVLGITAGESQAEFLTTDASVIARIPNAMTFTDAAAIPEVFITAHDAVFSQGDLRPGETLLVHAVGSGVGLAALQLAKAKGAAVIGTSRTADKLDKCLEMGLDHAIATDTDPDFSKKVLEMSNGRGADVILDLVGAAYFEQNMLSLAKLGRMILVGLVSGRKAEIDLGMALQKRVRIFGTSLRGRTLAEKAEATRSFTDDVLPLFADGKIKSNVERVFSLSDTADAYKYLASNESFGKIVVEI